MCRRQLRVIDGDTIKMDGACWHLWGIDAPENDQTCGNWTAGVAQTALRLAILDHMV
jgi:endonuclease YncB( thermonuclease family)